MQHVVRAVLTVDLEPVVQPLLQVLDYNGLVLLQVKHLFLRAISRRRHAASHVDSFESLGIPHLLNLWFCFSLLDLGMLDQLLLTEFNRSGERLPLLLCLRPFGILV